MTTEEITLCEKAKEIAQKLVNLESDRKSITDEQKDLKDELLELFQNEEEHVETHIDVQNGLVYLDKSIKFSLPDGLLSEIQAKVKDPKKLSQDLIEESFKPDLKLTKEAKNELKNSENVDLAKLVVQEEKLSIKIKLS